LKVGEISFTDADGRIVVRAEEALGVALTFGLRTEYAV